MDPVTVTVTVALGPSSYPILLGENLLIDLARLIEQHAAAHRYAVITDSTVERLYAHSVMEHLGGPARCHVFSFPVGEWSKTRDTWASLTDQLLSAGYGRDTTIVALGGGVVGDVAGFVAATFLRGVPYVQVPTTLLAMIDSSIGGKTGVDTAQGKNLVGAFHQPKLVVADVGTLSTLPPEHIAAGAAEAIKHGAIADAEYFRRVVHQLPGLHARHPQAMIEVIHGSVEIKARVVAEDEREQGKRAILNFGHTVGHALEAISGYELPHGRAVGLGMLAEARLGSDLGFTDPGAHQQLADAVQRAGLLLKPPFAADPERILDAMGSDKKRSRGSVRFAFLERVGHVARDETGAWTREAPPEAVRSSLARFW